MFRNCATYKATIFVSSVSLLLATCSNPIMADSISQSPVDESILHVHKGVNYERDNRLEEAISQYSQAIIENPKDALAYSNRAVVYSKLHHIKLALKDADKAVGLEPYDSTFRSNRAALELEAGLSKLALKDLNVAILYDSRRPEYYQNRALVYKKLRQFRAARADFLSASTFYQEFGQTAASERMRENAKEMLNY